MALSASIWVAQAICSCDCSVPTCRREGGGRGCEVETLGGGQGYEGLWVERGRHDKVRWHGRVCEGLGLPPRMGWDNGYGEYPGTCETLESMCWVWMTKLHGCADPLEVLHPPG